MGKLVLIRMISLVVIHEPVAEYNFALEQLPCR